LSLESLELELLLLSLKKNSLETNLLKGGVVSWDSFVLNE
jgi:hypothetical protein